MIRENNIAVLQMAGPVFCLNASPELILKRTEGTAHRPILECDDPKAKILELLRIRGPFYAKADYQVDTTDLTVLEVVDRIVGILSEKHPEVMI